MTLFPLWGRKKITEPANIGKITIIVNQGKKFVVKTRYTWTRKTRAQNNIYFSSTVDKKNQMDSSRVFWNISIS